MRLQAEAPRLAARDVYKRQTFPSLRGFLSVIATINIILSTIRATRRQLRPRRSRQAPLGLVVESGNRAAGALSPDDKLPTAEVAGATSGSGSVSVSYTHLDVYKRQT